MSNSPPPTCPFAVANPGVSSPLGSLGRILQSPCDPDHTAADYRFREGTNEDKEVNTGSFPARRTYLIEELVEKLYVNEHGGGVRQFICYDIEECFGAQDVVLRSRSTALGS